MEKYRLHKIGFGSFIKLFMISGIGVSILFLLLCVVPVLITGPNPGIFMALGLNPYTSLTSFYFVAAITFFSMPLLYGFFGIFMYPFTVLFLKVFKGIKFKAQFEEVKPNMQMNNPPPADQPQTAQPYYHA